MSPLPQYTNDYGSQYDNYLNRLNSAFSNNATNDKYGELAQGKQLLDLVNKAKTLGVDPSQLSQYISGAENAVGSQASYDLRRGQTSGQAQSGALSSLGGYNDSINSLLQLPQEKYNQTQATNAQLASEQAQRDEVRKSILASIPGLQNQLGDQLLTQQNQAYTRMAPQIESRLNALGLLKSGALPEAQARAQQQLEEGRQNQLANFGLAANQRMAIDFPLEGLASSLGQQQNNVQNGFQLDLANITRNFQRQDMSEAADLQKNLSLQALEQARNAQRQQSNNAMIGMAGQLGGAAIGAFGGPAGSAIGSQVGGRLAGMFGGGGGAESLAGASSGSVVGLNDPYSRYSYMTKPTGGYTANMSPRGYMK